MEYYSAINKWRMYNRIDLEKLLSEQPDVQSLMMPLTLINEQEKLC